MILSNIVGYLGMLLKVAQYWQIIRNIFQYYQIFFSSGKYSLIQPNVVSLTIRYHKYCLAWSQLSISPLFRQQRDSKLPFDHRHPQQIFEWVLGLVRTKI